MISRIVARRGAVAAGRCLTASVSPSYSLSSSNYYSPPSSISVSSSSESVRSRRHLSSAAAAASLPRTMEHDEATAEALARLLHLAASADGGSSDGGAGTTAGGEGASSSSSSREDSAVPTTSASTAEEGSRVSAAIASLQSSLKPREVVAELDKHVVGQADAKRAVAVALRNRWRRQNLPESLRAEIIPKNILMIGPTGCGKTEIARRMAKLSQAPFIKVEATKFTETGFHGKDVDQIIKDLVEVSISLTRKRITAAVQEEAARAVEERLLDCLISSNENRETFRTMLR